MKHRLALPAVVPLSLALAACSGIRSSTPEQSAQAVLHATSAAQPTAEPVTGVVDFDELRDGSVHDLAPGSQVGFHIHERGVCERDGSSAGDHFNPCGKAHGEPGKGHAGDLPMLQADATGSATVDDISRELNGVVGRGLIVHRDVDDYKTQPSGNAGPVWPAARWWCAADASWRGGPECIGLIS